MFEFQKLSSHEPNHIIVQTRRSRDVANQVGAELTDEHIRRYDQVLKTYGKYWRQRKPAISGYNCAGHVWANRRTCIYEDSEWTKILEDDGYRKTAHPMPDDVVLYADRQYGMLHVGRVVELREGVTPQSPRIPWVVSKWNDWAGEAIHSVVDAPFSAQGFDVAIEYWTDRPATPGPAR